MFKLRQHWHKIREQMCFQKTNFLHQHFICLLFFLVRYDVSVFYKPSHCICSSNNIPAFLEMRLYLHTLFYNEIFMMSLNTTYSFKGCLSILKSNNITSAGHRREGKKIKYKKLNQSLNGINASTFIISQILNCF